MKGSDVRFVVMAEKTNLATDWICGVEASKGEKMMPRL